MNPTSITDDNYFLPDFCTSKAVLLLIVAAELLALVLVLAGSNTNFLSWTQLALTSLFVQWVVLSSAALLCTFRPFLSSSTPAKTTSLCVLVCLGITSAFTIIASHFLSNLSLIENPHYFWQENGGLLVRNNIIALIITALILRYFFLQRELLRQKQSELTSRIQSLQSRIQPHFLFNSMNTIASLISSKPEQAEQVVEDLSDLFRASIDDASVLTPVQDEITLAQQYMQIEKIRFGERLSVTWVISQLSQSSKLPRLCLQPLLENAIVHGIQPDTNNGEVIVSVDENDSLNLTVCNTLADTPVSSGHNNQMALKNISDRLQALYGDTATLTTRRYIENDRSWHEARLTIPVMKC